MARQWKLKACSWWPDAIQKPMIDSEADMNQILILPTLMMLVAVVLIVGVRVTWLLVDISVHLRKIRERGDVL